MVIILTRLAPWFVAVLLCQCGVPHPPQCHRVPRGSRAPAISTRIAPSGPEELDLAKLDVLFPATLALDKLALPRNIIFHSVIGDRGKCNTPESSDGVVPYWSSHVAPVASEKIVPCNHSVPNSPEAAEELKRILKEHLRSK